MKWGSEMKRIRVGAQGIVQGVGFRFATKTEADRIGVTGWVRNVGSDRVEAEVQGDERRVDEMREWLRHGPPYATVEQMNMTDVDVVSGEAEFAIGTSQL